MKIPGIVTLEDVDGNPVEMDVIGSGNADVDGERRIYLALYPTEATLDAEAVALVVRWVDDDEGVVAIEDDSEFQAALDALEMDPAHAEMGDEVEVSEISFDSRDGAGGR